MNRLTAILLLWFTSGSPVAATDYPARVVGISDGDTITVLKADRTRVKLRLAGIDAPETGQDFGSRAKQAASELTFGKEVLVRPSNSDRYGRIVAEVILPNGRSLNRELVGQGMAWWYHRLAPGNDDLAKLEAGARTAKLRLWSQLGAVPPWDWRHGRGVPVTAEVIGNRKSHIYRLPRCRGAAAMTAENRISFNSSTEAEAKGYRRAGDCRRVEATPASKRTEQLTSAHPQTPRRNGPKPQNSPVHSPCNRT